MRLHDIRMRLYVALKAATPWCVFLGIAGPGAHSQESPAPPTPHRGSVLPDTHVAPRSVPQKPGIVVRIDGPTTVEKKMCSEHTFEIKYSVINNSAEPASGVIRASFNGVALAPVGNAKLSNLPPGKQTTGMFTACCPASGTFTARMDYRREESSTAHDKAAENVYSAPDSLNIRCR